MREIFDLENIKYCEICGRPADEKHHIIPKSMGWKWKRNNTVWLCIDCHKAVHNRHKFNLKKLIELRCFASTNEYIEIKNFVKFFFSLTESDENLEKIKRMVLECIDNKIRDLLNKENSWEDKALAYAYLISLKNEIEKMFFGYEEKFKGKYMVIR